MINLGTDPHEPHDVDAIDIRIELPLPIDITATLIQVIGLTWPGTMIKDGTGQWRSDNRLVLSIPDADRHKSPKKAEKYAKVKAHLEGNAEALITELGPAGVSMGLPDYVSRLLIAMCQAQFAEFPDAANYLESKVHDRESHEHYVVICARSEDQTPHALRRQAESERDAALEQLTAIRQAHQDYEDALARREHGAVAADRFIAAAAEQLAAHE